MCGIWALFGSHEHSQKDIKTASYAIQHRGPDQTVELKNKDYHCEMVFHRLSIMDISNDGSQPFEDQHVVVMCNGEIYNFRELIKKYKLTDQYKSSSDCEIILHLYKILGFRKMLQEFKGVFAIVLLDKLTRQVYVGRDRIGIRPLFYALETLYEGKGTNICAGFSSEVKGLISLFQSPKQFPCAHLGSFTMKENGTLTDFSLEPYWSLDSFRPIITDTSEAMKQIRETFEKGVQLRMSSDRPIGALLSGGLDSSLVCGILQKYCKQQGKCLTTFSIGMKESSDIMNARVVSDFLKTNHHEIVLTEEDFLKAIPDVIKTLESYDTTTVRASTPMYLLSQYISQKTDIKVIFSGELSDELCEGYMYFHKQPHPLCGDQESKRLVQDVMYFDVLRADRTTARWGLELREPFADQDFIELFYSLHPALRCPVNHVEKWIVRQAFSGLNYIPDSILHRPKVAFSDGISKKTKTWFQTIQDNCDHMFTDKDLEKAQYVYELNPPVTKEQLYYRTLFESYYPGRGYLTPYFWLPKWCGQVVDPSATVLEAYKKRVKE